MENRIADGMKEWSERAKRLQGIFGPDLVNNKAFQQSKLEHYQEIIRKTWPPFSADEKVSLALIKAERKRMLLEQYPTRSARLIHSIKRTVRSFTTAKSPAAVKPDQPLVKEKALEFMAPVREIKAVQKKSQATGKLLQKSRTHQGRGLKQ